MMTKEQEQDVINHVDNLLRAAQLPTYSSLLRVAETSVPTMLAQNKPMSEIVETYVQSMFRTDLDRTCARVDALREEKGRT